MDGDSHDDAIDDPLYRGPDGAAAIAAGLKKEAMTDRTVDAIVHAESEGDTARLAIEAQIDKQVVVEEVEGDENAGDDAHNEETHVFVRSHRLAADLINNLSNTTDD